MRLIDTQTLELKEFVGDKIPKYAILSHAWGDDEVTFQEWQDPRGIPAKVGYFKIKGACQQARKDRLGYLWVDTNCIDKNSSAELTEAINSMFAWYRDAVACYAYLSDVPNSRNSVLLQHFRNSRWFTRGWTLQELLAPTHVVFYASDWSRIGEKSSSLSRDISQITGIHASYLRGDSSLALANIAKKMSWLSRRKTTRIEDMAYCMLGIFDINMPLLYGEGPKAFSRLQEEIVKISTDQTIFCWAWTSSVPKDWVSMLAPFPEVFQYSGDFARPARSASTYSTTNTGIAIRLPLIQTWASYFAVLYVEHHHIPFRRACIPLEGLINTPVFAQNRFLRRTSFPAEVVFLDPIWEVTQRDIVIQSRLSPLQMISVPIQRPFMYGLILTLGDTKQLLDPASRSLFSQSKPGNPTYLIENTKTFIKLTTYPLGLFDSERSMFLLNYRLRESVYGGLVLLRSYRTGCVLLFAVKVGANNDLLWYAGIVRHNFPYPTERQLDLMLKGLGEQAIAGKEYPRWDIDKESGFSVAISDQISPGDHFRVAHYSVNAFKPAWR